MAVSKRQLILNSLKDGRKQWADLERELVKSGRMGLATLSRNLRDLERDGVIRRIIDSTKRPAVSWYVLADFHPPIDEKVENAVEELRREFRFLREPTVKEVAIKVGEVPETVRSVLYRLAPKIGWREQEKGEAEKEAEEAINLAGWLKWTALGDFEKFREISDIIEAEWLMGMNALQVRQIIHEKIEKLKRMADDEAKKASNDVLLRAKRILKEFPQLIPNLRPTHSSFRIGERSEETKRVWFRVFGSEPPTS